DKPVLNIFRMLGQMGGQRVAVESTAGLPLAAVRDRGVRESPDISALATRGDRAVSILIWNYHDDNLPAPPSEVELIVQGLPSDRVQLDHYRVDADHSNSYEAWKKMGSPQQPSPEQYAKLEESGHLQLLSAPQKLRATKGTVTLRFTLARQ